MESSTFLQPFCTTRDKRPENTSASGVKPAEEPFPLSFLALAGNGDVPADQYNPSASNPEYNPNPRKRLHVTQTAGTGASQTMNSNFNVYGSYNKEFPYPSPDMKRVRLEDPFAFAMYNDPFMPEFNQSPATSLIQSPNQTVIAPMSPQSPYLPNHQISNLLAPLTFPSPPSLKSFPLNPQSFPAHLQMAPIKSAVAPRPVAASLPITATRKAIAKAVAPSSLPHKESLPLPHRVYSDNGKRCWELKKSIGKGGCGEVYLGHEVTLNQKEVPVAVKIIKDRKQFLAELQTMKTLNEHQNGRGYTPKLIMALKKRKVLVMEFLSDTISARFEKCGYRFSLKTICMLAMNMMSLVRDFNDKTGQAHVDIKPSNLCTSPNGRDLFLIDFGYSTSPSTKLPGQTGTPLFMACNLQTIGATYPQLQDDYESIGYVLMFLISGGKKGLPWGGLRTHKEIAACKNDQEIHQFCQHLTTTEYHPLAQTLATFLFVCRDRTKPFTMTEYNMLYQEWEQVLTSCGWMNDKMYDWVEQPLDSSLTLVNSHQKIITNLYPTTTTQ